ncbi:hypothetical protein WG909_10795 [Peptostreptococcaceae bacterium AGR-M142]
MHSTKEIVSKSNLKSGINLYHKKFEQGKLLRIYGDYAEIKFYGVGIKRLNIDTCINNHLLKLH